MEEVHDDISKIIFSSSEISDRVASLGTEINEEFLEKAGSPPVVVGVATGACIFLADLVRSIALPITLDLVRVESYALGTVSNGHPRITSPLKTDIQGKHVIVVEDIVDTGNTLSSLISYFKAKGASSVSVCTFLDKPGRRKVELQLLGKGKYYCGFQCPDEFVVGYGLDYAEMYRNLPYVGVLKPHIYK